VLPSGDFRAYIDAARAHAVAVNRAVGTPIPAEDVAAVGPFELRPKPPGEDCRGRAVAEYDKGALLIHGLNDTPFSMWDLAHRFAKACYLVRAILLPGHGTAPGDLLTIGLPAWRDAVAKGIWSFRGQADRLVIVGFDLGGNLALDAALDLAMPPELELNGVALLAPAFAYEPPSFAPASVGPGGDALWDAVFERRNALRYHSVSKPAVAAVNRLGRDLAQRSAPDHLPLFVVASAEDAVADPILIRTWFCEQTATPRHLLWYARYPGAPFPACRCEVRSRDPARSESEVCVSVRSSACAGPGSATCRANPYATAEGDAGGAILDLAHIGLLAAPGNPRYGAAASTRDCLHYSWREGTPEGRLCAGERYDEGERHLRYGEASAGNLENYVLRRLTYNPDFDHMAERMIAFFERSN
jgi:alpha-beta hydrolase superfamily lysophospholipase